VYRNPASGAGFPGRDEQVIGHVMTVHGLRHVAPGPHGGVIASGTATVAAFRTSVSASGTGTLALVCLPSGANPVIVPCPEALTVTVRDGVELPGRQQ
jgi:hypothetical protein